MVIKGAPAPNTYSLPPTLGYQNHDPSRWRDPAYTMRAKLKGQSAGLGPGMYNISHKTRFNQTSYSGVTMGQKFADFCEYTSPGPAYYKPEKCRLKPSVPKITMGPLTKILSNRYVPSANTYTLPSTIGPYVPDKPCNGAFTMGKKIKSPRGVGFPGPNRYGPVKLGVYKPAGARITMGRRTEGLTCDKTQKPAPNCYKPKLYNKPNGRKTSFGRRDNDSRIVYLTFDDIKQS